MPSIRRAIRITSQVEAASVPVTLYGVPLIAGISTAVVKNTPKEFVTLADIATEHGSGSAIYKAAVSIFAQGCKDVITISISAAAAAPTAEEVHAALAKADTLAGNGRIAGAVLAGLTTSALLAELKEFADRVKVVFVVTNAEGDTVSAIVAEAAALSSVNGYFVAYKGSSTDGSDIAAAVLGAVMVLKPWVSLSWKPVVCDVDSFYTEDEVDSLEAGKVNALIEDTDIVLSNTLSTLTAGQFFDITRTQYYIEGAVKDAVAAGRLAAKDGVPFTSKGLQVVRAWIVTPLETLKRNSAIADFSVVMPAISAVSDEDKAARKLSGVNIAITLAGDIQAFAFDMGISV